MKQCWKPHHIFLENFVCSSLAKVIRFPTTLVGTTTSPPLLTTHARQHTLESTAPLLTHPSTPHEKPIPGASPPPLSSARSPFPFGVSTLTILWELAFGPQVKFCFALAWGVEFEG